MNDHCENQDQRNKYKCIIKNTKNANGEYKLKIPLRVWEDPICELSESCDREVSVGEDSRALTPDV